MAQRNVDTIFSQKALHSILSKNDITQPQVGQLIAWFEQGNLDFETLIYWLGKKKVKLSNENTQQIAEKEATNRNINFTNTNVKTKPPKANNLVKPEDLKTFFTNVRNENIKNYLDQVALVELGFTGDKNDEKSTQGNYPYSNDEKKRADTNSKAFANTNLDALGNDYFNHLVAKFPFLEKLPPFDDRKKNEIKDAVYKPFENVGLENYKFSIATVNEAQYRPDEDLIKNLNGLLYPQKKYDSSFGSNVQFSTDETHTSKEALKLKLENIELYQGRISAINIIHDVPLKKSGDVNSGYRNSYTKFYKLGDNFEINLHLPEELSIEEEEMLSAFILKHKEVFALQCNNERYKEIAKTAITLEQNNEVQTERCRNFKDLFYSLFGIKYQSAIKNAKNVNVNGVNTLHTNISLEKPNDALSIRYILEAALENQASHINNLEITLDKKNDLEKQLAKIIKKRTDGKITKDNIPIDTLTLNYTSISSEFTNDDQVKLKSYIDQLCSLGFKELNIKINVPGFSAGVDNFESVFNAFKNSLNNKQTKVVFDIFNNKKEKASMAAAGAGAVGTGVYKAVKIEEVAGEGARGEKELKKAIDSLNNTSHADGKIEVEVEQNQEQEEEQEQEQEEEQEQESSLEIKEEDLITRENIASFYDDKNNKKIPLSPDVRSKIELFVLDNKLGCRKTFGSSNQERFLRRLYDRIVGHEKKNKGLIFDKKITSITSRAASILITKFAQRNFDGNLCKEALPQGFYFVKKGDKLILDYDARKVSVNNRYGLRPKLKNTECKYDEDLLDIFNKNLRERGIDTIKNNSFINYIEPDNYASFFFRIIDILDIIKKRNKKITPEQQTQIRDYFLLGEIPLDTDDSIYYAVKYEGFDNISPEMIIRDDKSIKKKDNQLSYKVTLTELQDYLNKAGDKADLKTLQALFLRHIATPVKEGEPKINIKFIEAREIMQFQGMQDLYASVNALAVNDDKKQKAANIIKLLITFPIIENVKSIKTKIEAIINNNAITLSSKSFEALQESNPSLDDILNLSLIGVHKSNKQPLDAMLKHKNFKKIDWSVFKIVFHNLNIIKNSNVIENKLKYIGKVLLNKTCSENDKVKKIIACSFYTGETPDNFVVSDADFNKIANKRLNVNAVIPNNLGDINDNDVNIESINGSNSDFCFFNIQEIKSKKTNDNINDEHFFKLQFINAFKLKGMVFAPSEMRRLESICTLLYAKRAVIEECRTSIINQGKNEKDKKSISDCLTFFKPIYEKMPDRALEIITLFLNDNELKANIEHIDRFYRFIKPLSFDKELFLKFCNLWKMIIAKGNVKENKNSKEIEKLKSFSNVYNSKYLSHEEKLKALDVESHVSDCILKIKEIEEGLKKERVDYDTEIFKDLLKAIVKQSNVKQRIYFNIITKLAELAKAPELTKFTLELIEILNRKSLEENFDIDYVDTFIKQIVIDKGDKQKKVKLFQSNTQKIFKSAIVSDKNKPANIIPKNVIFINQINDPLKNTIIIDKDNNKIEIENFFEPETKKLILSMFDDYNTDKNGVVKKIQDKIFEFTKKADKDKKYQPEPKKPNELKKGNAYLPLLECQKDFLTTLQPKFIQKHKNCIDNILLFAFNEKRDSAYYEKLKNFKLTDLFAQDLNKILNAEQQAFFIAKNILTLEDLCRFLKSSDYNKDIKKLYIDQFLNAEVKNIYKKNTLKTANEIDNEIKNYNEKLSAYNEELKEYREWQEYANKSIQKIVKKWQRNKGGDRQFVKQTSLNQIHFLNLLKQLNGEAGKDITAELKKRINSVTALSEEVYNLDDLQMQQEIKACSSTLSSKVADNRVKAAAKYKLLALLFESYYRVSGKYPDLMQVSSVLLGIEGKKNLEISTGQGKTIIVGLSAAFKALSDCTSVVTSATSDLARAGLLENQDFYNFVGIKNISTINSSNLNKVKGTINQKPCIFYTTPADAFFFLESIRYDRSEQDRKKIAEDVNIFLSLDEVDTSIDFASTIWQATCPSSSREGELLSNIINYTIEQYNKPGQQINHETNIDNYVTALVKTIPKNIYSEFVKSFGNNNAKAQDEIKLILAAIIKSQTFQEDKDYAIIETDVIENGTKVKRKVVKIISKSTGELIAGKWGDYVHIVKTKMLEKQKGELFITERQVNTYTKASMHQLLEYADSCMGVSGTLGTKPELELTNIQTIQIPISQPFQREDHAPIFVEDNAQLKAKLLDIINNKRKTDDKNRKQPILIIADNIQEQQKILQFLETNRIQNIASITGKESEEERLKIIKEAMEKDQIVVATGLVGRGTDWKPQNKDGLMVINLAKELTYREYIQILGRSGRRGATGDTYTLLENKSLSQQVANNEKNAFEAVQDFYGQNSKKTVETAEKKIESSIKFDKLTEFDFYCLNKIEENNSDKDPEGFGVIKENSKLIFAKFQEEYKNDLFDNAKFDTLAETLAKKLFNGQYLVEKNSLLPAHVIISLVEEFNNNHTTKMSKIMADKPEFNSDENRNKVDFESILQHLEQDDISIVMPNNGEEIKENGEKTTILSTKTVSIPNLTDKSKYNEYQEHEKLFMFYGILLENGWKPKKTQTLTDSAKEVTFNVNTEYLSPLQVYVKDKKLLDKVDCLIKEAPIKKDGAVDEFVATFKTLEAKNNFLTNNPGNPNDVSAKLPVQEQVAITLPIVFTKKINGELKEFTVNNENGIDDFAINYLCNLDQIQNDNKYKDNPDTNLSWNGLSAYQKAILFWESKIKNQSKGEMPPSTFSVQDGFKTYFNFKEKSYTWMRMAFSNLYKQANLKHNITITGQPSLIPKAVDDSLNKAKIDFTEEEKNIIKELEEQNITLDCEKYNQFSLSLDNSPTPKQRKVFNEMINSLETNGAKQITFDGIKYTFVLDDRNKILTLTKPQLSPVESDVVKKLKEKKIDLIPNSDGGYSAILKNPTYKDKFLKRLKELGAIDIKSFNSDIGETVYTFKKLEEAKLQELAKFDASQGRSFGSGSGTVSRIRNRVRRVRSGVDSGIINRVRSGVGSGTGSGKKDKRRGIVDVPKGHFYKPTNNKNDNKKAEYNLQTALYKTPDEIGYYKDIDTVDDVKNGLDNAKRIVKKPPPRQRLKEDYEKKETQVLQRKDRDTETRNPWENGALLFIRIVLDILTLGLLELIGFFDKNKKMTTSLTKNSTTKSEQNLPEKTITKSQHATLTKTPHKNKIIYSLKDYQPSFIKSH